jgi:dTDP-4-amino-4,6-dideoxygalactose transaminase
MLDCKNEMTNVTQTFLPPMSEYQRILERAWANKWLTNRGELVLELESEISKILGSTKGIAMNNGTIPIQIALKLLGKRGEIITTPFSYVATTNSIVWEGCKPIFVDIEPDYWTIDPARIEEAITENTTCILATHVFGNPCDVMKINAIAKKYNLSVIYDAAHSFGVTYAGKSIFDFGDISTCSFHATKIFHSGEGGMLFTQNDNLFNDAFNAHNFGHNGPTAFHGVGINGKMSELSAAMGLAVLPYLDEIIAARKEIVEFYFSNLSTTVQTIDLRDGTKWNYSYFPVVFETEKHLLNVIAKLSKQDINPRRYFYPSLNTLNFVNGSSCLISESLASRILCLPLFVGLVEETQSKIINTVNNLI